MPNQLQEDQQSPQPAAAQQDITANPQAEQDTPPHNAGDYLGKDAEDVINKVGDTGNVSVADLQKQINGYLKEIKVGEDGKFQYPEDVPAEIRVAIAATKSMRDNQSAYTRARNEAKALQAELEALKEQLSQSPQPLTLTQQESEELETLKYADPDAWYQKMREIENRAAGQLNEQFTKARETALQQSELMTREELLADFNQARLSAGLTPLTPQQLELEVPLRYAKDLQEGKYDFITYLEKAADFIDTPKKAAAPKAPVTTDMNNVNGSAAPEGSPSGGIDYATVTF